MAERWQSEIPVSDWLYRAPWEFEFFQAARLMEQLAPARALAGEGVEPDEEAVRFRSAVTHVFRASEVEAIAPAADPALPPVMTSNLFALGGVGGPLPDAYADMLIEGAWRKNYAMRDFLDIFHHRLLSLLVRGRKAHHPSYTFLPPREGPVAHCLYAFLGMALDECRNRLGVADGCLIYYAGLLSQHPRSASGLERLLGDFFGVPAGIRQLIGQWRELEPETCTRIGVRGANQALGQTALLGKRIWDQQGAFEVTLGPLAWEAFSDFLPPGRGFGALCELTRFYAGPELAFSFRLILRAADVPSTRIGHSRLNWTSWLKTKPSAADDSQVRLRSTWPADRFAPRPAPAT